MGSVEPLSGGKVQVGEDFELIGWDFVSNPSTHGAIYGSYERICEQTNSRTNSSL